MDPLAPFFVPLRGYLFFPLDRPWRTPLEPPALSSWPFVEIFLPFPVLDPFVEIPSLANPSRVVPPSRGLSGQSRPSWPFVEIFLPFPVLRGPAWFPFPRVFWRPSWFGEPLLSPLQRLSGPSPFRGPLPFPVALPLVGKWLSFFLPFLPWSFVGTGSPWIRPLGMEPLLSPLQRLSGPLPSFVALIFWRPFRGPSFPWRTPSSNALVALRP